MPAKKQITKEMILAAALKLLKEQGYHAVNIKQLSPKSWGVLHSLFTCPFMNSRNLE